MASSKSSVFGFNHIIFSLFIVLGMLNLCDARKKSKPPLIEDLSRRRPSRPTHCQFGNQSLEIEERWRPNLGPPFGVLFCVRCECIAVQRKNRIVARVRCKNIKNDCPKPTCDNPVLLPERCCKTCPGEDYAELEAVRNSEHEEDDGKEFSVLMTGRGLQSPVATDSVAKGYFSFAKRNLQYFIKYSGSEQPSFIRFTDDDRNILEEHELSASETHENGTKTVCGIWKKVPRVYRGLLRKGRLHVVITTPKRPEGIVGGKLMKGDLLHTEVFSALLTPNSTPGKSVVSIPSSCLLRKENANALYRNSNYLEDEANDILVSGSSHKCYYEGEIFEDGAQWKAQQDDCQMCSCQRGRVKCDQVMCPTPSCSNPVTVPNECCPTCVGDALVSNSSKPKGCYFEGDKKFHLAGTKWHPYLPPFGFDRCSLCTCLSEPLLIECKRSVTCPALTCPEHEAFRENAMDCCKQCRKVIQVKSITNTDQLGDQRSSSGLFKSPNELLASGGCRFKGRVYENGDFWHPTVQPFGEVKCVNCHCKDKNIKCKRTKCPKLSCSLKVNKQEECCPRCADLK